MQFYIFESKISCVLISLALFFFTLSPSYVIAGTWTQYYMVTDVYPTSSGIIYFKQETQENPDNCSSSSWYRMKADYATKGETYALVLTSIALGNKIRFHLDGCDGNHPSVNATIMDVNQ